MKSIMTSVSPYLCEKIASGQCKILVRKSAPKEVPFKAYIYATKPKKFYKCGAISTSDELLWLANGKVEIGDGFKFWADSDEYQGLNGRVIGEFICDKVEEIIPDYNPVTEKFFYGYVIDTTPTCLSEEELQNYGRNKPLYGWHISDLKIYDKPLSLSELGVNHPPQSYMFVEEI